MTSLGFEEMGKEKEWEGVSFVHVYPGITRTGLEVGGLGEGADWLVKWVVKGGMWLVGSTAEEVGERVLYLATSERFARGGEEVGSDGKEGSGVYSLGRIAQRYRLVRRW